MMSPRSNIDAPPVREVNKRAIVIACYSSIYFLEE